MHVWDFELAQSPETPLSFLIGLFGFNTDGIRYTDRVNRRQASTLIGGLAGERTRWTDDSEKSADLKRRLVGDCALGSAFVSYCGPFNQEFRSYIVTDKFTIDLQVRFCFFARLTSLL